MRAVVIAYGSIKDYSTVRSFILPQDMIIAADGGAIHAQMLGITPDVLIGDFDSLSEEEVEKLKAAGVKVIRFPKEKDYTDTHLAIAYAIQAGAQEVLVLAGLGSRLDHTLGTLLLAFHPDFKGVKIVFKDEQQEILAIAKDSKLKGVKGDTFSLIPLENISGLTIEGAKYPIKEAAAPFGGSLTISNEFLEEIVGITWREGEKLLLVRVFQT